MRESLHDWCRKDLTELSILIMTKWQDDLMDNDYGLH